MPDELTHLTYYLAELGYVVRTGEGTVAVDYGEIWSWQQLTQHPLSPAHSGWLHHMSSAYANELGRSSEKQSSAPYEPDLDA